MAVKKYYLYDQIEEVLTLAGACEKSGRRVNEKDLGLIKKGAVLTDGHKIIWVGRRRDFRAPKNLKGSIEDAHLGVATVMPSFTDCHTHLWFAGDRKNEFELRNQGVSYQEISARGGGIRSTVNATRKLSLLGHKRLLFERLKRLKKQGVATVEIKTGYGLNPKFELLYAKALGRLAKEGPLGLQIVPTFLGAHSMSPECEDFSAYTDQLVAECFPKLKKFGVHRVDMFVEGGFFSAEVARGYFEAAAKLGLSLVGHVDQLSEAGGTDVLLDLKGQSADHLVCVSEKNIKRLAKSDVTAVLLPISDLYLKINYPPARALLDQGARVALATDYNPGSAPSMDLSLLGVLSRLQMRMTLPEVIVGLTYNANLSLGLSNQGYLSEGSRASMIGLSEPWDSLFYEVGHHPVELLHECADFGRGRFVSVH